MRRDRRPLPVQLREEILAIIEQEGFIDLSNVMLVDPADNRPSRVRVEDREGRHVRVFARSGDPVPEPAQG